MNFFCKNVKNHPLFKKENWRFFIVLSWLLKKPISGRNKNFKAIRDSFLNTSCEQARKILEEAQRDKEINHMACNFKRIPGKLYHIYKRPSARGPDGTPYAGAPGKNYMSMISPEVCSTIC